MDGDGLRTHFSSPMHTLRSSGYTLSGIYIDYLSYPWVSAGVQTLAKRVVQAAFLIIIHQTRELLLEMTMTWIFSIFSTVLKNPVTWPMQTAITWDFHKQGASWVCPRMSLRWSFPAQGV